MDRIPKLGIIAIAKKNHQKDEIYQFVTYYKDRFSKEEGIELMLEEKVLFDEAEIADRAKKMEENDADLIVLIVGTWIYSSIVISAVNDFSTPFVLCGLSDRIANGNLGASLQIRYVLKKMENIDEEEARKVEEAFLARIDKVNWEAGPDDKIFEDAIFTQAKMYLAFKRLKKLYGIDVFANKCMPEMSAIPYGYGYADYLATCMLNEDGIITACEADVPAGLSMYILNLLTGQKVFFADIARLNKPEKRITFFNCGTAPISMADRKKGVQLWPIPGNICDEAIPEEYYTGKMKGASINFELEEGRQVTLMRIGGNDDTLRFHVAKAMTITREVEADEVLGQRWPGFGLKFEEDIDLFLNNTTGHHYSIVFGDCVEELRYLAQILGIQFVFNR